MTQINDYMLDPGANWCPDCGEPRGICRCEEDDWPYDDPEMDDRMDWVSICDCGQPANDDCGFCGKPLCFRCFEVGAGFCSGPHTDEQIAEYARYIGLGA